MLPEPAPRARAERVAAEKLHAELDEREKTPGPGSLGCMEQAERRRGYEHIVGDA